MIIAYLLTIISLISLVQRYIGDFVEVFLLQSIVKNYYNNKQYDKYIKNKISLHQYKTNNTKSHKTNNTKSHKTSYKATFILKIRVNQAGWKHIDQYI